MIPTPPWIDAEKPIQIETTVKWEAPRGLKFFFYAAGLWMLSMAALAIDVLLV